MILDWRSSKYKFIASLLFFIAVIAGGNSLLSANDKWRIVAAIPGPVRRAGRDVIREARDLPYLPYRFASHDLPVYDLSIDPQDLAFLEANIPSADAPLLTDEFKKTVPATLLAEKQTYDIDIRYRGGSKVHWLWPKKSYRIEFKKNNPYHGEPEIDLIVPNDRQYVVEEFNNYRAQKLGLIVPESRFVVLRINGRHPAVYWEVERPGKPLLEKQGLSGDANFYDGGSADTGSLYDSVALWDKAVNDPRYKKEDRSDLAELLYLIQSAPDEFFYRDIFSLLDKETFYRWNIHTLLSKSNHQDWAHNMRLYFDPSFGKFIIMPWDVGIEYNYADLGDDVFEQSWNPLVNRIFKNPEFMAGRNQRLWKYVQDEKNIKDDLAEYDRLYKLVRVALYQDRVQRFDNGTIDKEIKRYRDVIERQFYYLQNLLNKMNGDGAQLQISQIDVPMPGGVPLSDQKYFKGYEIVK